MKTYEPNKKGFIFLKGGDLYGPSGGKILTLNVEELAIEDSLSLAKLILKAIDESEEFK